MNTHLSSKRPPKLFLERTEAQDVLDVVGKKKDYMKRVKQWDMLSKEDVQSVLKSFQVQVDKALSILFCPHSSALG